MTYASGKLEKSSIKLVQPTDSKKEDLIQLADILLGSVGYMWNHTDRTRTAKNDLCIHIESKGNRLRTATKPAESKFNIWKWKPDPTKEKRPGT